MEESENQHGMSVWPWKPEAGGMWLAICPASAMHKERRMDKGSWDFISFMDILCGLVLILVKTCICMEGAGGKGVGTG